MSSVSYSTPRSDEPGVLRIGQPSSLNAEPAERADAARNRALLLDAAQQLVREHGVAGLTMDALAKRAGVGKGTVFRRFGNRSGLMLALLDHSEQKFQTAFMFGPGPLGPEAEPIDRLIAFGRTRLLDIELEGDLHRAAEEKGRFGDGPYALHRAHIVLLLRAAGVRGELALVADGLLATLSAALVLHQMEELGYTRAQIGDNWEWFVHRVVSPVAQVE
ncbi:TetR family transcriptional regulator [Nocardia ignorata]|uniref:TetR family transcriptional regulator n=1 Tax=Nocardia ignorata TaxID=145285 RepID=A0A4R6PUM3_NOCIG|nr:TetR family transcriptional regulator [Nocardia ignorata]